MTPKQKELLDYIREYTRQHEFSPSYNEIAERLQLRSKSGVNRLVIALAEEGFITHRPHRARSILLRVAPPWPKAEDLAAALWALFGLDGGHVLVCSQEEATAALRTALA